MLVSELRDELSNYPDDAVVRIMSQPHYPFEYDIEGLWESAPQPNACGICGYPEGDDVHTPEYAERYNQAHEFEPYESDRFTPEGEGPEGVVYITEGGQRGYGTTRAWSEY